MSKGMLERLEELNERCHDIAQATRAYILFANNHGWKDYAGPQWTPKDYSETRKFIKEYLDKKEDD